jgi:hypothetical protein
MVLIVAKINRMQEGKDVNPEQVRNKYATTRVSSKHSMFFFGSNRYKPKLNLIRFFFGLFRETKNHFFRFVSVCFGVSDLYRNNRNKPKKSLKNVLY